MNVGNREEILPLTPSAFYSLVGLAERPTFGHDLMKRIERDSGGIIEPASGTIYPLLARLEQGRMIAVVIGDTVESSSNKKVYKLTGLGRQVLAMEIDRLERLTKLGRQRVR